MKKSIILLSTALMVFYSCKEKPKDSFIINGDITGLKDPYIYLQERVGDSIRIDSATVTDGKFTFRGEAQNPYMAAIFTKPAPPKVASGFRFYLQNADINITGNIDSLNEAKVMGSATQDEYEAYKASVKDISDKENALYEQYSSARKNKDTAALAGIEKQINELDDQMSVRTKDYIAAHPKSAVSLNELQSLTYSTSYAELNKLFTGLDTSLQNTHSGKKLATQLAIMEKTAIGKPALAFTQNDVNGKPVSLSDFRGKYVLVDFWASWCGPCRAENPNVLKAYNQYKDKNFTVFGVSLDEKGDNWKKAVEEDKLPWTQASDLKGWKNEAAQQYGVNAIPANYLIDPNGIIIGHNLRGEDLENKLAEVLE
jgi:peroxiredoxin